MATVPPQPIDVAAPERLRYGLFTAAPPQTLPERNLGGGSIYEIDWCGPASLSPVQCEATATKAFEDGTEVFDASPFAVYAGHVCGRAGHTSDEHVAKARQKLISGEQGAAELALWTGLTGVGGDFLGIIGFNNGLPTTVAPLQGNSEDMRHVVGALEQFAYLTSGYGHDAYIHAPVAVETFAADHQLIVQDGDLKRTPYGSIWVFGGGYPATDESGALADGSYAMYVTGQVHVWRADDVLIPNPDQTLDRETNQQYVLAERTYAIGYDCLLGQIQFDVPAV